ncbi:MAG TPA: glycosyltransferase family 2 protein [Actinoplanes sp.]|nr:glycosyltransferase family 2 protein [Actinoplanes sp.]
MVIPALNERENISRTIDAIPAEKIRSAGHDLEVVIVDNGSTDGTGQLARQLGAKVIVQPVRGYGNAYKAGFANCSGEVIATGDADLTYPFEILPEVLLTLEAEDLDFVTTNRLDSLLPGSMSRSHVWGNKGLSAVARTLFGLPFADSQSGMWVFRRKVWTSLRMRSGGMAFSQELKIEAFRHGFRCHELPIAYYPRGGQTKINTVADGVRNLAHLLAVRARPKHPLLQDSYVGLPSRFDDWVGFRAGGVDWRRE